MKTRPEPLKIERRNWLKLALPLIALAGLAAVLAAGLNVTGRPSFCGRCHAMQAYVAAWEKSTHRSAACTDCHADPGFAGALVQRAEIAKHYSRTRASVKLGRPALAAGVSTAGCLRCHQSIAERTVVTKNRLRVSHKEIIAGGLDCGLCHAGVGHRSRAAQAKQSAHTYCFACHQRLAKKTACSLCHTADPGAKGAGQLDNYGKIEFDPKKCSGCHTTETCSSCHEADPRLEGTH